MLHFNVIRSLLGGAALLVASVSLAEGSRLVQGVLPEKVDARSGKGDSYGSESGRQVEAWDINGDGYPDLVRVEKGRPDPSGISAQVAYDFDADGKPDFFRTEGGNQGTSKRD